MPVRPWSVPAYRMKNSRFMEQPIHSPAYHGQPFHCASRREAGFVLEQRADLCSVCYRGLVRLGDWRRG